MLCASAASDTVSTPADKANLVYARPGETRQGPVSRNVATFVTGHFACNYLVQPQLSRCFFLPLTRPAPPQELGHSGLGSSRRRQSRLAIRRIVGQRISRRCRTRSSQSGCFVCLCNRPRGWWQEKKMVAKTSQQRHVFHDGPSDEPLLVGPLFPCLPPPVKST